MKFSKYLEATMFEENENLMLDYFLFERSPAEKFMAYMDRLLHKSAYQKALQEFIKMVDSGIKATTNLVAKIAKFFIEVEWRTLVDVINSAVERKVLDSKYKVAI